MATERPNKNRTVPSTTVTINGAVIAAASRKSLAWTKTRRSDAREGGDAFNTARCTRHTSRNTRTSTLKRGLTGTLLLWQWRQGARW